MTAPPVTLTVEPMVGGQLVYLQMAPSSAGGKARGRLLVELTLKNNSSKAVTATTLSITFPGSSLNLPATRPINMLVGPFQSLGWNMASAADQYAFDMSQAPTTAKVAVAFAGFSDPVSITVPIVAHRNDVPGGAYHFPSWAGDLRLGEFWQMNGSSHDPGNHQGYAYDMAVLGLDHHTGIYSPLTKGVDPYELQSPNEDYRIWGKPVRAMADGEVLAVVNDCPNNPTPLYQLTIEELDAAMLTQRYAQWEGFPNGESGNHVYIQHGNEVVLYAHMQRGSIDGDLKPRVPAKGSIPAIPGTLVKAGQELGLAGNSGNSSAPHLHIHATGTPYATGPLRPMVLTGAHAIDNDLVMVTDDPGKPTEGPSGRWSKLATAGIPEGSTVAGQGGVGDSFVHPSGGPVWPEVVRYGIEENAYQGVHDAMKARGLKPVWINAHTVDMGPTYFYTFFNVVFRPALGADEPTVHGLDKTQYQNTYNDLIGKGYHLKQVESYFSFRSNRELFAAIFAKYGTLKPLHSPRAYHAQPYAQHRAFFDSWVKDGYVPTNISVTSVQGQLSYTALYEYRGSTTSGIELDEHMSASTLTTKFGTHHQQKSYLHALKGYVHDGRNFYAGSWSTKAREGKVRNDLSQAGFRTVLADQRQGGHLLTSISGYQLGGSVGYAGIWNG